jgi:hypothetical protein
MSRSTAETVVVVEDREIRRCLHCHRSAIIDLTEEQEQ